MTVHSRPSTLTDQGSDHVQMPVRRRLARGGLVAGPVLLAVGAMIAPEGGEEGASLVAAVRDDTARWTAGHLVAAVGALALLAGLAHLASRLPYRARTAATGLTWFATGVASQALLAATELMIVPIAQTDDTAAAAATVDRISESTVLATIFLGYLPGMLLGGLLLMVGLRLCRLVSTAVAAVGCFGVLFGFFLEDLVPAGDVITAAALATALLLAAGWRPRPTAGC